MLARGALVCPSCSLPIFPVPRLAPRALLRCGFCDHADEAVEFLARGTFDAPANERDADRADRLSAGPGKHMPEATSSRSRQAEVIDSKQVMRTRWMPRRRQS